MRAFLLLAIIVALAIAAIIRPKIGALAMVWFALARPDVTAWAGDSYPYASILELGTLIGSVKVLGQLAPLWRNPIFRLLLALLVPILLSVVTAIHPTLCYQYFWWYASSVVSAVMIPLTIQTEKDFRRLVVIMALSMGWVGSKYGLYGMIHGGVRYSSGFGGSFADNNTLALALVMGIPLCWYGRNLVRSFPVRAGLVLAAFLSIAAVVFTHSRGAAIAAIAAFLVILIHARHRFFMLVALVLLTAPSVYLVKDTYFDRMETLKDTETAEQDESVMDRVEASRVAWRIFKDYPVMGVGFGSVNQRMLWRHYADPEFAGAQLVVHDTYLQMLADSGIFALLTYVALLGGTIILLERSSLRLKKAGSPLYECPLAIEAGLIAFAVGSTFLTRIAFDFLYFLLMAGAAWLIVEPDHLESLREQQENLAAEEDPQLQEAGA
jgi:probable O-glycosylation ligase (exosortase A-associated)